MNQQQFEDTFAARKLAYRKQVGELTARIKSLKKEFHQGNAELEKLRKQSIMSDPTKKRKKECYSLQRHFGNLMADWKGLGALDTTQAACQFDCTGEDKVVFTITIQNVKKEEQP